MPSSSIAPRSLTLEATRRRPPRHSRVLLSPRLKQQNRAPMIMKVVAVLPQGGSMALGRFILCTVRAKGGRPEPRHRSEGKRSIMQTLTRRYLERILETHVRLKRLDC